MRRKILYIKVNAETGNEWKSYQGIFFFPFDKIPKMISGYFHVFLFCKSAFCFINWLFRFHCIRYYFALTSQNLFQVCRCTLLWLTFGKTFTKRLIFVHFFQYLPVLGVVHILVQTFSHLNPKLGLNRGNHNWTFLSTRYLFSKRLGSKLILSADHLKLHKSPKTGIFVVYTSAYVAHCPPFHFIG